MDKLKKEKTILEETASKLLSLALNAGAEKAEVCASYGVKTKITLEKQDFQLATADDGFSFGLRVLVGHRQGFSSGNTTAMGDLKEIATKAVILAKMSPENPYYVMQASENVPTNAPTAPWDESLFETSLTTQREWTKLMVTEATSDKRLRLSDGSLTVSGSLFLVANSLGTQKLERSTDLSWGMMGMAVDGDNITSFDYHSELARNLKGIPDRIAKSTGKFRDQLLANLKTGPGKSYRGVVLFSPRGALDVLVSGLMHHFNARNLVETTARWKWEERGKAILSPLFSLTDNPWHPDRFGWSTFDREGTPTAILPLIEKGQLQSFMADTYAATALGTKSTGNALGGPSSLPAVSSHNLTVGAGQTSLSDMMKSITQNQKEVLMVHRFSGQTDPISGDFSGVAKGGEWWVNGEHSHFVKETSISGNIFSALGPDLTAVSKETQVVDCGEESPTLACNNVSVTAPE